MKINEGRLLILLQRVGTIFLRSFLTFPGLECRHYIALVVPLLNKNQFWKFYIKFSPIWCQIPAETTKQEYKIISLNNFELKGRATSLLYCL